MMAPDRALRLFSAKSVTSPLGAEIEETLNDPSLAETLTFWPAVMLSTVRSPLVEVTDTEPGAESGMPSRLKLPLSPELKVRLRLPDDPGRKVGWNKTGRVGSMKKA